MTISDFVSTLAVATTIKAKSEDDKVLFEASNASAIFQVIGSYKVVNWKTTDANRVVVTVEPASGSLV